MRVCDAVACAKDITPAVTQSCPHIVVLELALPDGHGLEMLRRLRDSHPALRIVVFSNYHDAHHIAGAFKAGAHAYVDKKSACDCVLQAIRTVHRGERYTSPELAMHVLGALSAGSHTDDLSDREATVLELIGQGYSTKRIAASLSVAASTVETYRERLKRKLKLRDAAELVQYATRWLNQKDWQICFVWRFLFHSFHFSAHRAGWLIARLLVRH